MLNSKKFIKKIVTDAAKKAFEEKMLPSSQIPEILIEETKHESHGDFSTNFAMTSASIQKMAPQKIAQSIISVIETGNKDKIDGTKDLVGKVEMAGPGFINFFLANKAWHPVVDKSSCRTNLMALQI